MQHPIPRANSGPIDQRTGAFTREWRAFLNELQTLVDAGASDADIAAIEAAIAQLQAEVNAIGGGSAIIGQNSVKVTGSGPRYVYLENDTDNPGFSYFYGTNSAGAKGWWRVFDVINADTDDFVQTDSGYVVLGEVATPGDLPGSGSTGEAWRVTDVSPGLYAWDGSAFTLDPDADGIVGLALAEVPDSGTGTLQKTAFDAKGRKTGTASATTTDLPEGDNLYYTDERAAAAAPVQSVNGQTGDVVLDYTDVGAAPADILQQNTTASYVDGFGITNTISIARASDFDDGGIRYVAGGASFRQQSSSTEEYDTEIAGFGLATYLFNPSQSGAAYTTTGVSVAGPQISFTSFSISQTTKGFLGSRYITLEPESIDDPTGGGFDQKIVKVQNKAGTLALTSDIVRPVPLSIAAGDTFTVQANTQALWTLPIELGADASIEALGDFVQVA